MTVCSKLPLVPWTVIGYMPEAVEPETVKVRAETPKPVIDGGAKDAVTPEGMPLAARLTSPLNPFKAATAMVELAEPPTPGLTAAGVADRV